MSLESAPKTGGSSKQEGETVASAPGSEPGTPLDLSDTPSPTHTPTQDTHFDITLTPDLMEEQRRLYEEVRRLHKEVVEMKQKEAWRKETLEERNERITREEGHMHPGKKYMGGETRKGEVTQTKEYEDRRRLETPFKRQQERDYSPSRLYASESGGSRKERRSSVERDERRRSRERREDRRREGRRDRDRDRERRRERSRRSSSEDSGDSRSRSRSRERSRRRNREVRVVTNLGIEKFNGSQKFEVWIRRLEIHAESQDWSEGMKVANLIYYLDESLGTWVGSLHREITGSYDRLCKAISDRYSATARSYAVRTGEYLDRKQKQGEKVATFYAESTMLGKEAGVFGDARTFVERIAMDAFVDGLLGKTQERVRSARPLSLSDAYKVALDVEREIEDQQKARRQPTQSTRGNPPPPTMIHHQNYAHYQQTTPVQRTQVTQQGAPTQRPVSTQQIQPTQGMGGGRGGLGATGNWSGRNFSAERRYQRDCDWCGKDHDFRPCREKWKEYDKVEIRRWLDGGGALEDMPAKK